MPVTKATVELTLEEKTQKAMALTQMPESVLKTAKVAELREIAKGLFARVNSYNKADLLQELLLIRAEELARKEAIALAAKAEREEREAKLRKIDKTSREQRCKDVLLGLEKIVATDQPLEDQTIKVASYAAGIVAKWLMFYADTSVKGFLSEVAQDLRALNLQEERTRLAINTFVKSTWSAFNETKIAIATDYKESVQNQLNITTEIHSEKLLNWAENTLKEPLTQRWEYLVIALTIATGRRMAEILSSAVFKIDTTGNLLFAGQLKAKGDRKEERMKEFRAIPCLVDPKLVLTAIEALDAKEKRIYEPADVNQHQAKPVSRQMAALAPIFGLKLQQKDLRAFYACYCLKHFFTGNERGRNAYLAQVMGHNEGDLNTAFSYYKFDVV